MSTRTKRLGLSRRLGGHGTSTAPAFSHRHAMPSRRARRVLQQMQARERRHWMVVSAIALILPFGVAMVVMETLH
jgi:hypothetical protein